MANLHALIANGVNADGYRESSASTSPPPRTACRLADIPAVADRPRPVGGQTGYQRGSRRTCRRDRRHLAWAARQRCPTHYTTNLMAVTPKA